MQVCFSVLSIPRIKFLCSWFYEFLSFCYSNCEFVLCGSASDTKWWSALSCLIVKSDVLLLNRYPCLRLSRFCRYSSISSLLVVHLSMITSRFLYLLIVMYFCNSIDSVVLLSTYQSYMGKTKWDQPGSVILMLSKDHGSSIKHEQVLDHYY